MKEYECPLCGENLRLNKEGTMTNKKTGEFIYVVICDECDQAFGLENDKTPKLIPYDSEMKLIENKCKVCSKIENYNEKGLFLLNVNTGYYEFHCFACAIPVLQVWFDKNSKNKKKLNITEKNVQSFYEIYDFNMSNQLLQNMRGNPERFKGTLDKVKKELESND